MSSPSLALEMLPLTSVIISVLLSCLIWKTSLREGIIFTTTAFVLSFFSLSPVVLAVIALNNLMRTPFLHELFSFRRIRSWIDWFQIVSFEDTGSIGLELTVLLTFTLLSVSLAVWLASNILSWRLSRSIKFFSSVLLLSLTTFLLTISVFRRA